MSNRTEKVKMWNDNPHCFWCKCLTQLTNNSDGKVPHNAATIDHLYSRYDPRRWVKRKPGQIKKVLSCHTCNQHRGYQETKRLSKEEILRRSQGFSLNPIGNPHITKTFDTLDEVLDCLKEKGVDISKTYDTVTV